MTYRYLLLAFLTSLLLGACTADSIFLDPLPTAIRVAQAEEPTPTGDPITTVPIATVPTTTVLTATAASTETPLPTATLTPTETATATASPTPEPTATETHTPTATATATPEPTPIPTQEQPSEPPSASEIEEPDSSSLCFVGDGCLPTPVPTAAALANNENILLLGTDRRDSRDGTWRTDTMLLASIDWETPAIGIISLPRDLLVDIPEFGQRRINEVDFLGAYYDYPGGTLALLNDTFLQNFGVHIDHYARLHRSGFVEGIDAIGGVDIFLECDLWEMAPKAPNGDPDAGFNVLYFPAGQHHFSGEDALRYSTFRYRSGDWDRRRRQQEVLIALREQAVGFDLITQIPQLLDIVGRNFSTDIGILDMARYARLGLQVDLDNVRSRVIGRGETIPYRPPSGAYYLVSKGDDVYEAIANVFEANPIAAQKQPPDGCPPAPDWAQEYLLNIGAGG